MWKLGLRPRNSFSGKTWMWFSLQGSYRYKGGYVLVQYSKYLTKLDPGCPRKKKIGSNRKNETRLVSVLFRFVLWNQKQKNFCLFRFVLVFRIYIETTETNRKNREKTEKTGKPPKFSEKNNKICSLSNCFSWSSVCFGPIETSKLSVSV